MNIAIIVLNGMSLATTVLLAQYLGAKDERKVSLICTVSIIIICLAILVTTGLIIFSKK